MGKALLAIGFVRGDATAPRGDGGKIIAHVCNDVGAWGKGFVLALSRRWPQLAQAFKQWYQVQQSLIGDQGQSNFDANVKEAQLPGGDVKFFKGTVISMDPAEKPTKIVVGVSDPTVADATLTFDSPVTSPVKVGDVIEFSGVADSFTKSPYIITFSGVEGPDLKTTAPAKPKPHKKRA